MNKRQKPRDVDTPEFQTQIEGTQGTIDIEVEQYIKQQVETDVQLVIDEESEAVQLAAVQQYGDALVYIEKPSEAVQLAAVQQNGYSIYHVENPSEAVQLAAVQRNGHAFYEISHTARTPKVEALALSTPNNPIPINYAGKPKIVNPIRKLQVTLARSAIMKELKNQKVGRLTIADSETEGQLYLVEDSQGSTEEAGAIEPPKSLPAQTEKIPEKDQNWFARLFTRSLKTGK